ncbi:MAG: hypothetical protein E7057_06140 [Lentisphaerae bacterium]|nr:hypothetical protein [Lentisphaerota bacterium]
MKNLFLSVLAVPLLLAGAAVDFGNDLVKMKIEPVGGRISSLKLNNGQELTAADGLLGDNFTHHASAKFFLTRQLYDLEKSGNSVRLSAHHTGGGMDFLKLGKLISLKPGETVVDVKYTFHNLPAAMAANEYAFASQNFVNSSNGNIRMFFPGITGISLVPAHGSGMDFSYFRQPSRSWIGFTGENGGGLAITMDYRRLSHFYGWFGKKETTQEFYFDKMQIKADETVSSNVELILFHTLQRISGAGGGLVGEFSAKRNGRTDTQQQLKLRLYSARPQTVKLVFTSRKLREGKPEKIYEKTLHFSAGGTIKEVAFHRHFKQFPALFDIEARAYSHQGELLAIFNMPLGLGTGEIAYRMIPQENLEKHKTASIDLTKFDNSRETPHIKWAHPITGGTIRMLGLTLYPAYREMAELAKRMDIELHSSLFIAQGRAANNSGDHFGLLTETDISNNISELLQKDYDCIFLGGVNLDKLTADQRKEILRKVENGCGLVLIGCSGKNQDIFNISPLIPQSKGDYPRQPPRKAGEHFISSLFPWYLLPVTTCIPQKLNGTMVAKTAHAPFIAVREHGKGRVAAISFISNGGSGRMVGGLTPELPYPQENAGYREHIELYQLLFAKMIAYAAKRDNGCQIKKVKIESRMEKFVVLAQFKNLPASPEKYTLTIFSCNRDGEELTRQDFPFTTTENAKFILPAKRWNGQQMLGFILRDPQGNVTDFGAESAMYLPMARSHKLSADKTHYQENETAVFTLTSAVETKDAEVRWQLRDAFDRVVKSGKAPAQTQMTFPVKIASSLTSRNYTFIAEMYVKGVLCGRRSLKVTATPAPEKLRFDDFEVGIWITPYSYEASRAAFHKFYADTLREMGITTIMGNNRMTDVDFALANNFNPTLYKSGGTRPARISPEYRKSGNKMLLVRTPCLSSPEFRSKMQNEFRQFGKQYRHLGASFHWFGDELSLTGYWSSAIDFCFSPSCLKGFQEFLKKKYGSVEKASAQWGRNYTSFEQFIPETYGEAKAHKDGNYSAWADHLEYMDALLCDYVELFAGKGLQQGDPAARSFISGPQGPSAYGGNNWAIQSKVYTGLMSYNIGGLQDIMHSFNSETVDLPWILGYANYDGKVCSKLWKNLQYRVRGAMGFAMASMIRPDGTLSRSGQAAAKYLPEIRSGIGKLFIGTLDFAKPEAMILYSQSSIRSAYISGRAKEHEELRLKYIALCRNFGVPFRFVSEKEILSGILNDPGIKLLILPDCDALDAGVLAALGKFTGKGGKILAEGNLAGMDGSCRTRKTPAAIPGAIRIDHIRTGYIPAYNKAVNYRDNTEKALLDFERQEFAKILQECGITPLVTYRSNDGKEFYDVETAVMVDRHGNKYVLSVCKESTAAAVQTRFNHSGSVRTIRGDKSLMKDDNPLLFLFTDKEESGEVTLTVKSDTARQLDIAVDCGNARDTVCHISVKNPSGKVVRHYSANVDARNGKAAFRLKLAENDPAGVWQITVKDVTTNSTATVEYTLKQQSNTGI